MSFLSLTNLHFISSQPQRQQQYHRYRASASRGVPVYSPVFSGTQSTPGGWDTVLALVLLITTLLILC